MEEEIAPLTDEGLANLHRWADDARRVNTFWSGQYWWAVSRLLAEVERHRAVIAEQQAQLDACEYQRDVLRVEAGQAYAAQHRLQARLDATLPIVEAVADADNSDNGVCFQLCAYRLVSSADELVHVAPCIAQQARAYLAAHPEQPTAETAEGEGE